MTSPSPLPARDALVAFRTEAYAVFGARRDALFDLLDALLMAGPVASPVHLSLVPAHRRGHGSLYAALARGEVSAAAVERLLADQPLPLATDEAAIYAVDGSVWARCDAETSPERGFYHHPSRHSNGQPIVAGWLYQWVAQVRLTSDSWTAPLSAERVPPGANMNEVAVAQIQRVLARRLADGRLPLFAFDAGYDAVQLAHGLALALPQIVTRAVVPELLDVVLPYMGDRTHFWSSNLIRAIGLVGDDAGSAGKLATWLAEEPAEGAAFTDRNALHGALYQVCRRARVRVTPDLRIVAPATG